MRRYLVSALLGSLLLAGCGPALQPAPRTTPTTPAPVTNPAPTAPLTTPATPAPGTVTPAPGTATPGTTGMNLVPRIAPPAAPVVPAPANRAGALGYGYAGGSALRSDNMTRARSVARTAQGVPGVAAAYAMVSGNIALVGVQPATGTNPTAADTSVAHAVRSADPTLVQLYVTSDPRTVNSMRQIDAKNARGEVTNIDAAMRDIISKLPPTGVAR